MKTDHALSFYGEYNLEEESILHGWDKNRLNDIYIFRKTSEITIFAPILDRGLPSIYPASGYYEIAARWKEAQKIIPPHLAKRHLRFDKAGIPLRNFDAMQKWQYWLLHESWDIDLACKLALYGPWLPPEDIYEKAKKLWAEEISVITSVHRVNWSPHKIISALFRISVNNPSVLRFASDIIRIANCTTLKEHLDDRQHNYNCHIEDTVPDIHDTKNNNITIGLQDDSARIWETALKRMNRHDKIRLYSYYSKHHLRLSQKEKPDFIMEKCKQKRTTRTIDRYISEVITDKLYKKYNLPALHPEDS